MLIFHQRPTSGMWHLCGGGKLEISRCDCGSQTWHNTNLPTVHLNSNEVVQLLHNIEDSSGMWPDLPKSVVEEPHNSVCQVCTKAIKNASPFWVSWRKSMSVNYKKPVVVCVKTGATYQCEVGTLAAAKDHAKELAEENEQEYIVLKPHTAFGPAKPKIIETKLPSR